MFIAFFYFTGIDWYTPMSLISNARFNSVIGSIDIRSECYLVLNFWFALIFGGTIESNLRGAEIYLPISKLIF